MNTDKRITKSKLTSAQMNIEKQKTNQLLFADFRLLKISYV